MRSSENTDSLDYETLSSDVLRALRGRRSQEAFARRVGCRPHTVYTWEAGRSFPTAARMFGAAHAVGVDLGAALQRFHRWSSGQPGSFDIDTPQGVAGLLGELRGAASISSVATAVARSRYAVARWLHGKAQPRVPDFFRLVDAMTLRLVDFVACLVDPKEVPTIAERHRGLEAMRAAAYDLPWSHAFLRALELVDYRSLPAHEPGWLANCLGLPLDLETQCLQLLEAGGQVVFKDGRYCPAGVALVDTGQDPAGARRLRDFFSQVGATRLQASTEGSASSAYNLFGISRVDLERIRALQRTYFREVRSIVAQSTPVETIVLANMQLVELRTDLSGGTCHRN